MAPGAARGLRSRRRIIPLVAGILIVALAAVAVARFALGPRGGDATAPTNALTAHIITLPASASLYCPSTPARSPDGKRIAVMAKTVAPGGSHIAMTDIQDNQIVLWQVPHGA